MHNRYLRLCSDFIMIHQSYRHQTYNFNFIQVKIFFESHITIVLYETNSENCVILSIELKERLELNLKYCETIRESEALFSMSINILFKGCSNSTEFVRNMWQNWHHAQVCKRRICMTSWPLVKFYWCNCFMYCSSYLSIISQLTNLVKTVSNRSDIIKSNMLDGLLNFS